MRALELRVPPLVVVAAFAAMMVGLSWAAPALSFVVRGREAIALLLLLAGALVALAGVIAFRQNRTTVNPMTPGNATTVVSGGVYQYSRNPMYLGFLMALAALALYLSNLGAALLLPGFVMYMNRFQVEPEERALLGKFGAPYAAYMASVRRWL